MPGTKEAPLAWYRTIRTKLENGGWTVSKLDQNLFYYRRNGRLLAAMPIHVDDAKGYVVPGYAAEPEEWLRATFKIGEFELLTGRNKDFLGVTRHHTDDDVEYEQDSYVTKVLKQVELTKKRSNARDSKLMPHEVESFRKTLGQLSWLTLNTAPELAYETSAAAGKSHQPDGPSIDDVLRLNRAVKQIKAKPGRIRMRRLRRDLPIQVRVICDGGEGEMNEEEWTRGQMGYGIGLGHEGDATFVPIQIKSSKAKRVTHSSFDIETITAVAALDAGLFTKFLIEEWYNGVRASRGAMLRGELKQTKKKEKVTCGMYTDCNSLVTHLESHKAPKGMSKRRVYDLADMRQALDEKDLDYIQHIEGKLNPMDCLTKRRCRCLQTQAILQSVLRDGRWST